MIRQYRIDRYNGLEVLVCDVYRKHTWTQSEYEAFHAWKLDEEKKRPNEVYLVSDFRSAFEEWLKGDLSSQETFYGLRDPISVYDNYPHIVLRGVIVENRIASLQVDYVSSVLPPEVLDEVNRFYGVLDSCHWRDMIDHQLQRYGSLFAPDND